MRILFRVFVIFVTLCMVSSLFNDTAYARGGGHRGHGPHVGIGFWFGPGWWPSYYPSYYYPYYYPPSPPVVVEQPEVYVQPVPREQQQLYWYYCKEPQGYYPYVKECPSGWMKVVPTPPAPDKEE